ncbi:MAG: 3-hydroxyacyl-CoA dehydrogenase NAD-binding domain-containing protein [Pseudomonadales bacterium]|nr:3-hydroxyacyl-CoA dehydrogenase NAD-binding domain-containing protein [Pseudomonadales bacterium]
MPEIKKIAVIGAGVMGAGIAAQAANAGLDVLLLDRVPEGAADNNVIATGAIDKLLKSKPAALMHKRNARLISPGNTTEHLTELATCDWVIEAIVENLGIKRELYQKIDAYRGQHTIVSSNTSTLPLADLTDGLSEAFRKHFLITHFFNPPRYMRLLELVTGPETAPEVEAGIRACVDYKLGKSIVTCKDTPGFIANRIGTYWLQAAVVKAIAQDIGVEEADAVLSRPAGVPKTGVFGLLDLVGLDLMPHILANLEDTLPKTDAFHQLGGSPPLLETMVAEGYTGRKGKGGFYRLNADKVKEVISLQNGKYAPVKRPRPDALGAGKKGGLRAVLEHPSALGRYAWSVLSDTLAYAAGLVPEIADDIEAVDRAMRLGYNWKYGPFELLDKLGSAWFSARLKAENRPVPALLALADGRPFYRTREGHGQHLGTDQSYHTFQRPPGVLLLEDIKRRSRPLLGNRWASVWDLGEGVACLEFHSKMNSLNPFILSVIKKALKTLPERGFKGMVIYNEGEHFSVGANIAMLLVGGMLRLWPFIRWVLKDGQTTFSTMKYGNFPVVGAPAGMALGGGCELLLHCHAVTAHAETYMGLVEAGVGIVPGWGGCKEMLSRWTAAPKAPKGPVAPVLKAFELIVQAQVSTSAAQARDMLFLQADDEIVMNRDRVLSAARDRVQVLAENFQARTPAVFHLPGPTGKAALQIGIHDFVKRGIATAHDATVAGELATVLSGAETDMMDELSEQDILSLERDIIVRLMHTAQSRARVAHMLKTGKPLRN